MVHCFVIPILVRMWVVTKLTGVANAGGIADLGTHRLMGVGEGVVGIW